MNLDVKEDFDEFGKPYLTVTSDKVNVDYLIKKSNDGFIFYTITSTKGRVPDHLQGMYTKMETALRELTEHLRTAKVSKTVERDRKYAAKSAAKHKEQVQQGAAD